MELLQDAKNAFRDQEGSPSGSPKRRGRQQEAGDTRRDRLEEYMRAIEQQMKTRFLAKIFKQEEDLRKLEAAAQVEEQQQLRAQFRAQQLKQLEARKLDCRVGLPSSPCLPTASPPFLVTPRAGDCAHCLRSREQAAVQFTSDSGACLVYPLSGRDAMEQSIELEWEEVLCSVAWCMPCTCKAQLPACLPGIQFKHWIAEAHPTIYLQVMSHACCRAGSWC